METRLVKNITMYSFLLLGFFLYALPTVEAAVIRKPANNLGLVGYWSFNDATSTTATDFSGRGNVGTLNSFSAPATASSGWWNGKFGSGLNFDGTGDYVAINGVADDVTETSFAVSMWIKSTWTAGFDTVLAVNTAALGNQTQLFIDNTLTIRVYDGTQDATELSSSGSVVDGKWHHVVYSRSGATGTLYVDGVSQGTHNNSDTFTGTDLWSFGQEFDAGPTPSDLYAGGMDEVRIYNRPLSGTDVTALYSSGLIRINVSQNFVTGSTLQSGLVGMWSFNGPDITTVVQDRSGNSNNGYIYNVATGSAKTIGKVGQGLKFDGTDDYVSVSHNSNLNMTSSWSVSAWVVIKGSMPGAGVFRTVLAKGPYPHNYFVGIEDDEMNVCCSSGDLSSNSINLQLDTWYYMVWVFDDDENLYKYYLDGVQRETDVNNDTPSTNTGILNIAADAGGPPAQQWNGNIDEVRVYNRVLTATEVKQLYLMGR